MLPKCDYDDPSRNDPRDPAIITKDGEPFEAPAEGSLSLLALGYRGLMAWRAKRASAAQGGTAASPEDHGQA